MTKLEAKLIELGYIKTDSYEYKGELISIYEKDIIFKDEKHTITLHIKNDRVYHSVFYKNDETSYKAVFPPSDFITLIKNAHYEELTFYTLIKDLKEAGYYD